MMESMIKVSATPDPEGTETLARAIMNIMIEGYNCHADQDTIRKGIDALKYAHTPAPVSVVNCNLRHEEVSGE